MSLSDTIHCQGSGYCIHGHHLTPRYTYSQKKKKESHHWVKFPFIISAYGWTCKHWCASLNYVFATWSRPAAAQSEFEACMNRRRNLQCDFSVNYMKCTKLLLLLQCPIHFVAPDPSIYGSLWTLYYDKLMWCGFDCGVSKCDSGFPTRKQLRDQRQKKANSLSYFLSDSSNLIIKGIRPFLGPVSRAAGIVITTVSDGVQGLMALASLGHLALSWLFHRAGPRC